MIKSRIPVALCLFIPLSSNALAWSWQDLWQTKNQQAQKLMSQSQYKKAGNTFNRSDWQASANYRAGNYQQAAKQFSQLTNESGFYNQGNALAHTGEYEKAIKAYDKALKLNPDNSDAKYNRDVLKKLLEQQQKNNQDKNKQDKNKQDKNKQDKNKQDKNKQDKNKQDKNKQDKKKQAQRQNSQSKPLTKEQKEQQQAKQQWLKQVPDDPGGLLRQKFLRDYLNRHQGWQQ